MNAQRFGQLVYRYGQHANLRAALLLEGCLGNAGEPQCDAEKAFVDAFRVSPNKTERAWLEKYDALCNYREAFRP